MELRQFSSFLYTSIVFGHIRFKIVVLLLMVLSIFAWLVLNPEITVENQQ